MMSDLEETTLGAVERAATIVIEGLGFSSDSEGLLLAFLTLIATGAFVFGLLVIFGQRSQDTNLHDDDDDGASHNEAQ